MKRIIAIIFLVVYSSTAFAFTLKMHFCGGHFAGIAVANFGGSVDCGCDHSKHTHKKSCCSDKLVSAKTDNHKTNQQYALDNNISKCSAPEFIINYNQDFTNFYTNTKSQHLHQADLSRSSIPSLNIFLCTFRI
ncbi:MAG: hypothetical protein ABIW38_09255 [Ferruginibacter sp.]